MKTSILNKKLLLFWQEIVFILSTGVLLFEITKFGLNQNVFDIWDKAILNFVLLVFVTLLTQLYFNNKIVSTILSALLSLSSITVIFMALYSIGTSNSKLTQAIVMFFTGIFLLFTAITMATKNRTTTSK